jgi:Putative multicopper oxidases
MNQGEVQRWRLVNATPFRTLSLVLGSIAWNEIALDGMYLGTVDTWPLGSALTLQPGNRTDVLIKAPDNCSAGCPAVNLVNNNSEIIATVEFTGTGGPMPLPTSAEMKPLKNWQDIDTGSVAPPSQVAQFEESGCDEASPNMCVDSKTFNANNPPRPLPLNKTQGWNVSTLDNDHVFHIHVNPFQTVRQGPTGSETVWLDTMLIPKGATKDKPVQLWTSYEAITGKSVFHCHILPHEDLGMMQAIDIEPITVDK